MESFNPVAITFMRLQCYHMCMYCSFKFKLVYALFVSTLERYDQSLYVQLSIWLAFWRDNAEAVSVWKNFIVYRHVHNINSFLSWPSPISLFFLFPFSFSSVSVHRFSRWCSPAVSLVALIRENMHKHWANKACWVYIPSLLSLIHIHIHYTFLLRSIYPQSLANLVSPGHNMAHIPLFCACPKNHYSPHCAHLVWPNSL